MVKNIKFKEDIKTLENIEISDDNSNINPIKEQPNKVETNHAIKVAAKNNKNISNILNDILNKNKDIKVL